MSDTSRVEQLLRNALGEDIYEVTPQSRVEVLLQQLNELIEDMGASVDPTVIEPIVTAWLEENIHDGSAAVVDSSLTIAGAAADAKKTGDELSSVKENLETLNTDGIVPTSKQMLSDNYSVDSVPYHFRKTASDNSDREELEIVGGTVCWNQLAENGDFQSKSGWNPVEATVSDGVFSYTPNTDGPFNCTLFREVNFIENHKFLVSCKVKCTAENAVRVRYPFVSSPLSLAANTWSNIAAIDIGISTTKAIGVQFNSIAGQTNSIKAFETFDLTAMFGSTIADYIYSLEQATAGAGVAFFKSLFPNDYYPYNAGELKSVEGVSAHKTVGFNQWDGTYTANKWINQPSTGEITDAASVYNVTDYIRILPNTVYHTTGSGSSRGTYFDKDKNPIAQCGTTTATVFTSPSNAYYVRLTIISDRLATFCINISDPTKNGQYEPYKAHSYPLDSTLTLRGIPKLDANNQLYYDGDRYLPDGKVERRYGVVDLGTLNWVYDTDRQSFATNYPVSDAKRPTSPTLVIANIVCAKYVADTSNHVENRIQDKTISISQAGYPRIYDSTYINTDAAAFKAAMSGVMLVYELATPTTEEATPYRQLQICDPNGTEEFVSTGIVPVGHNTKYPDNLRMKLDNLPWNFASLIAPTESTFTATRNYTTGALLIVNNVLYKATANIANGGTITVGTNVTATTLAEVISALS